VVVDRAGPSASRSRLAAARAASRATIALPASWPVALAGFLARGGIVLFALPVLVLPTPTGLATLFGPTVVSVALNGPDPALVGLAAAGLALATLAVILGTAVGAMSDAAVIAAVAGTLDPTATRSSDDAGTIARIAAVRLVALVPVVLAIAWAGPRLVTATYDELVLPSDVAIPLVLRVAGTAAGTLAVAGLTWLVCEAIAGVAARAVVLRGDGVGRALAGGLAFLIRHPADSLGALLGGLAVLLVVLVPSLALVTLTWSAARDALAPGGEPLLAIILGMALATIWLTALALTAIGATWRSAIWTAVVLRGDRHPVGDMAWPAADRSATDAASSTLAG